MAGEAHQYLTWLQRTTWERLGIDPPAQQSVAEVRKKVLEQLRRTGWQAEELAGQGDRPSATPPTPYEDPYDYSLIASVAEAIRGAMRSERRYEGSVEACERIVFGTLPTGAVNARVLRVPGSNGYLALFNNGLFRFSYLLGKVLAQALDYDEKEGRFSRPDRPADRLLAERPLLAQRFRHVVGAYVVSGHPGYSRTYPLPPAPSYVASRQARCVLSLLAGHEYGHVIAGHLDREGPTEAQVQGTAVSEISFDHRKEYEADFIGLDLLARAMRAEKQPAVLIEWSPPLLLFGLHVVRSAFEVLQTGREQPDPATPSHPKMAQRLLAVLAPLYDDRQSPPPGMRQRTEWLLRLLRGLWEETRPFFEQGHSLRVAPAAVWLDDRRAAGRGPAAAVYTAGSRSRPVAVHRLDDGAQALAVGDWIWQAGDRHAATAAWRRALTLGQRLAGLRLARSGSFDPSLPDAAVFETR